MSAVRQDVDVTERGEEKEEDGHLTFIQRSWRDRVAVLPVAAEADNDHAVDGDEEVHEKEDGFFGWHESVKKKNVSLWCV